MASSAAENIMKQQTHLFRFFLSAIEQAILSSTNQWSK
jgi:hypothetical protein